MLSQAVIDTWNGYTNYQTPQRFMDLSRELGATTPEQAVELYMTRWAAGEGPSEDEAPAVRRALIHYLEATQGIEWS